MKMNKKSRGGYGRGSGVCVGVVARCGGRGWCGVWGFGGC